MAFRRVASRFKVGLKTFWKVLLLLCLVSLAGLLITHKDMIVSGIHPGQSDAKRSELRALSSSEERDIVTKQELVIKSVAWPTPTSTRNDPMKSKEPTNPPNVSTKKPNGSARLSTPTEASRATAETSRATTESSTMTTKRSSSELEPTKFKLRTTTFSFLGDEYATDDTHVHSECPAGSREKLQRAFREEFQASVPVLQWIKHAQWSQYRRLKQYAGAFGWMDVTWPILEETLNLLNSTGNGYLFDTWNRRSACIRCAVVGNAGIMNGSGMGKEIDDHDYVFRVNGAVLRGFEKDVGNRTSFYFFSTNTLMNSLYAYRNSGFRNVPRTKETRYVLLPDHNRDYLLVRAALQNSVISEGSDKGKDPANYFGKDLKTEHFKILHPDFMRYLRNRFLWDPVLKTTMRNLYRPSTGASMLLAAVHTCDQVNAYGFMTPNYKKFSDHYFDQKYHEVVFYINHSFDKEMKLWQALHKAGIISLFMRD